MRVNFMETQINGLKFNVKASYLRVIQKKDDVVFVREEHNEHDRNAVAVHHGEQKLGYVPASVARTVASLIDGGFPLRARVTLVDTTGPVVMILLSIDDRHPDR